MCIFLPPPPLPPLALAPGPPPSDLPWGTRELSYRLCQKLYPPLLREVWGGIGLGVGSDRDIEWSDLGQGPVCRV